MPVFYNPFGGLTPQDFWNGLEAYYPVYVRVALGAGPNVLVNLVGVRGAITMIGTNSTTVNLTVTLDGVMRINAMNMPANESLRIEGAFFNTCNVTIANADPPPVWGWMTYRRL